MSDRKGKKNGRIIRTKGNKGIITNLRLLKKVEVIAKTIRRKKIMIRKKSNAIIVKNLGTVAA